MKHDQELLDKNIRLNQPRKEAHKPDETLDNKTRIKREKQEFDLGYTGCGGFGAVRGL